MQFDRVINVKIKLASPPPSLEYRGTLEASNLRIAFSIFKSESWSTNTANIKIWNISESKRNQLNSYGDEVTLSAGYRKETGPEILFRGNSSLTNHVFAEPEIISVIDCGDGERSLNQILVSASFGANTPVRTVIEYYAQQLQLEITEFAETDQTVYALGHKFQGMARDGLDKACAAIDLVASVQNNNLVILRRNQGSTRPPIEISGATGMIGIPQRYTDRRQYLYRALPPNGSPKPGWKVRCLLRPDILPGQKIRLRSQRVDIDGIFYVISIRHEGDNFGPQFESLLEVIAV